MGRRFSESRELKELIEREGWTLYDLSYFMKSKSKPEFEILERQGHAHAQEYYFGGHYFFTPLIKANESLREAYSVTKGLGPCLLIDNPSHERWKFLEVHPKQNPIYFNGRAPDSKFYALFSRLSFDRVAGEDCVIVWTPSGAIPNTDNVIIRAELALDTFRRYFRVAQKQNSEGN